MVAESSPSMYGCQQLQRIGCTPNSAFDENDKVGNPNAAHGTVIVRTAGVAG